MKGFWLFVHNLGYTLWLGGGIATMIAGVAAKRFRGAERLGVYRVNGAVWRLLVGPGAMATLLSGLVLAMQWMKTGPAPGWMNAMMGVGLLGGLVAVARAMPAASRLARLELDPRGELPERFAGLRKKLIWTATISGGLGLLALGISTIGRFCEPIRAGGVGCGTFREPRSSAEQRQSHTPHPPHLASLAGLAPLRSMTIPHLATAVSPYAFSTVTLAE